MESRKRIVVTGMGLLSCLGSDVDEFYQKLLQGQSGIGPITRFPCEEYPTRFAGELPNYDPGDYLDKKQARRVDPFISYGAVAGKKALASAGLTGTQLDNLNKARCGIIVGSGMGGMQVFSDGVDTILNRGYKRLTPFFIPYIITNMAGGFLAMDLGFMGPNYSISSACATSNHCITAAANHIRRGEADLMLCGGVEAPILPVGLGGFTAIKALSQRNDAPQKASRPWDRGRDGFVMAEGAGVLVLESLEHALKRGAFIFAEYLGGAFSCDAHHFTEPRPDGLAVAQCIEMALADAQVNAEDIGYINAHGTSTKIGDMTEVAAIRRVFKDPARFKMNGTKSMIGHALGAAAALEAIATIKALQTGMLHPTINIEDPEPDLDVDIVPNKAQEHPIKVAISNSFGFGGHNAAVVFGKHPA